MREAHTNGGHRGRDATLARFRNTYCTPHGSKVAMRVKMDCQLCKLGDPQLMSQEMGRLPEERLTPSPPFTHVSLDLFGPFTVREEVQKRTSGKAYRVIFSDLVLQAIHIEPVPAHSFWHTEVGLQRSTQLGSQLSLAEKQSATGLAEHRPRNVYENQYRQSFTMNFRGQLIAAGAKEQQNHLSSP